MTNPTGIDSGKRTTRTKVTAIASKKYRASQQTVTMRMYAVTSTAPSLPRDMVRLARVTSAEVRTPAMATTM